MFGNYRKIEKKILSVILVMALSISLLSGCGQKNEEWNAKDSIISKEIRDKAASSGMELALASEEIEDMLNTLCVAIDQKNLVDANATVDALGKQFDATKEKTKEWLSAEATLENVLDDESANILAKRKAEFEKEIAKEEQKAVELLTAVKNALDEGNMNVATSKATDLRTLLVEESIPETYGESLPNEIEVGEAEEEAYVEEVTEFVGEQVIEIPQKTEENVQVINEVITDELLVTEGDTQLSDGVKEKAQELEKPLAIYNYLKNNIGYEYYYGSRKGASGTLDTLGGNDIDQASLLIAMLRYQGYQAKYVRGNILLTGEQAMSLTGATTSKQAADVFAAAGTPVTRLMRGEEIVYIRMEHVWVRAYIPYTDYRGAGNEAGDKLWIDLDTSIKNYETVTNIYDTLDKEGISKEIKNISESGDVAQLESLIFNWEEKLESKDLSKTYARKRIIKQEEVSYLPLSLQYRVEQETDTFVQVANSQKDSVSFEINDEVLCSFASSDIQGKDILLSFKPASSSDQAIYDSYNSVFDIPAYAVYMKPVLLVDGEVVAEGEDYLESTLGTKSSFTIHISSGGKKTSVTNSVTTGSMYAVTMDSQSITGPELQSIYDEVAALKESATEDNVYSEAYLGKLLNLAGKLYFAQVDIADTIAADMYDVVSTRSLSEGITGYEVRTKRLYGQVTGLSEGSLYIDIDADTHSVISLEGDSNIPREYMMSTGMIGSLYESTIWEEITGEESVSTISILAKASEENIDILLISGDNLSSEIKKLHTDETTKQSIINAVNSGMIVTVPAEDVTIGAWSGTGYIVTDPVTGSGAYMISGGLNGGSVSVIVVLAFLVEILFAVWDMAEAVGIVLAAFTALAAQTYVVAIIGILVGIALVVLSGWGLVSTILLMSQYVNGDEDAGQELIKNAKLSIIITVLTLGIGHAAKPLLKKAVKNKLVREFGEEIVNKLLKKFDDITDLGKYIRKLRKAGIADDLIQLFADKEGKEGLDWLLRYKHLGLSDDLLKKILKTGNLDAFSEDILTLIKNSKYTDEIIEYIVKYGDDAAKAIREYGDEAVKVIKDYEDEAIEGFKNGKTPSQIIDDLNIEYPITFSVNGKQISLSNAKEVWKLDAKTRGVVIEELLARSEYAYWWHCGAEAGGYFPVVDFQKGTTVVSLKSIDPSLKSYSNGKGTDKILEYIDALSREITIEGKTAEKILDVRVPQGTLQNFNRRRIMEYSNEKQIKVIIKEYY